MPRVARTALAGALAALALAPSAAPAKVPAGFFGVMVDGPATELPGVLEREAPRIRAAGAQTVRFAVDWASAQPYATMDQVPAEERPRFTDVDGVPTDLARVDRIVRVLAAAGLRPLPVILHAPDWAAKYPGPLTRSGRYGSPPARPETYAAFLATLARRYGATGTLWQQVAGADRRPIRSWQIWNEVNLGTFWADRDFQQGYVALLRAARRAVRAVDPRATIVAAGLTNGSTTTAWEALRRVYAAGGRGTFDAVALHPYTGRPANILRTVREARRVMRARGDARVPILLTEISFSSSGGDSPDRRAFATWDTSERGQADRLRSTLRLVARQRRSLRIGGATWYTWLSPDARRAQWSDYAGLSRMRGDRIVRKPALLTYSKTVRELSR